jgi:hypothetical protein
MGRRKAPRIEHLPEKDIQDIEAFTPEQQEFFIERLGHEKTSGLITALLRSYRISAHVSNAAWKVVKESETGAISPESFRELQKALHIYSPLNFLPFKSDVEFAALMLESVYNTLESWDFSEPSKMLDFAEYLYDRIVQLRTRPVAGS